MAENKEINQVAELYHLGNIKNIQIIKGGMINYNFNVETDRGHFIVRKLGYTLNKYWTRQKSLEFKVLEYLHSKNFPYQIPKLLRNDKEKYLSHLGSNIFQVYVWIPGKRIKIANDKQFKEMIKALAIYHKTIKGFSEKPNVSDDREWLAQEFVEMNQISPKTPLDKLMLKHVDFFQDVLNKFAKLEYNDNILITHSGFHKPNLLFSGDKLTGILDFEHVRWAPKASDLNFTKDAGPEKIHEIVTEYKKYNSLSKKEIKLIVPLELIDYCETFRWAYRSLKKRPDLKYKALLRIAREARSVMDVWETQKL